MSLSSTGVVQMRKVSLCQFPKLINSYGNLLEQVSRGDSFISWGIVWEKLAHVLRHCGTKYSDPQRAMEKTAWNLTARVKNPVIQVVTIRSRSHRHHHLDLRSQRRMVLIFILLYGTLRHATKRSCRSKLVICSRLPTVPVTGGVRRNSTHSAAGKPVLFRSIMWRERNLYSLNRECPSK